eukprot:15086634-Alexandrium_andersonii.AAC.1
MPSAERTRPPTHNASGSSVASGFSSQYSAVDSAHIASGFSAPCEASERSPRLDPDSARNASGFSA